MKTSETMIVLLGVLALSLLGISNTALGDDEVLWTEGFEGYSLGDLPAQDATWVHTSAGSPSVDTTDVNADVVMPEGVNGLKVETRSVTAGIYTYTDATKDLTGEFTATNDLVSVEFDWRDATDGNLGAGQRASLFLMDSSDTQFVELFIQDAGLGAGLYLNSGSSLAGYPERSLFHAYELKLDFSADTVELIYDTVSLGTKAFKGAVDMDPGDLDKLALRASILFGQAGRYSTNWIDDIAISQFVLAGDVNGDGFIGGVDMNILLGNWGMTGASRSDGDVDGDGTVSGPDYSEILANWGGGTLPPEAPGAVPEPGTLLVLAAGVLAGLIRRR